VLAAITALTPAVWPVPLRCSSVCILHTQCIGIPGTSANAEIKVLRNVDDNVNGTCRGSLGEARSMERKKVFMNACFCYSSRVTARSQGFLDTFRKQLLPTLLIHQQIFTWQAANNGWY